jgi:hypothetical protein
MKTNGGAFITSELGGELSALQKQQL